MNDITTDNPPSTNGRVYMDDVVEKTRDAVTPKRGGLSRLLLPVLLAGVAIVALRTLQGNRN